MNPDKILTTRCADDWMEILNQKLASEIHKQISNKTMGMEGKNMPTRASSENPRISFLSSILTSPKIKDVDVIVENKVVEVAFADGTKTKSVCSESDTFSLETAISVCIAKKIMGGSSAYNNAIKRGMKVYNDKLKKNAADKAEQERIERKRAKRAERSKRKAIEKEQAEKERQIEIQKEAYIRAMEYMKNME